MANSNEDLAAAEANAIAAAALHKPDKKQDGEASDASESCTNPSMVALFSAWQKNVRAMFGDVVGLAAAESKLAAVGMVQLLVGALLLISLATLMLVCLEIALAILLLAVAVPPAIVALLMAGLNALLAYVIYRMVKPLPENLTFEHTRKLLSRSNETTSNSSVATRSA